MDCGTFADIRELIIQTNSTVSAHGSLQRLKPDEIKANYRIEETLSDPRPDIIALVDDVLSTGAHFKAAQSVLLSRFPGIKVIGLFIARRVLTPAFSDESASD